MQRRLVAAERKLLYFLVWANEQSPQLYSMLVLAVGTEFEKHLAASPGGGPGGSSSMVDVSVPGVGAEAQLRGAQAKPASGPLVQEL